MSVQTFPDSDTPLSGWHWVCPCGWTVHNNQEPPTDRVMAHRADHIAEIVSMRRSIARAPSHTNLCGVRRRWNGGFCTCGGIVDVRP